MDNEQIARIIEESYDEWLLYPRRHLRRNSFESRSYRRWAVQEIANELRKSPLVPPIMVVEDFIERVESYSADNPKKKMIFRLARDIGKSVLDLVSAMVV